MISHDRWFLDRVATHILAFEGDSTATWFEGSWEEYAAWVKETRGAGGARAAPDQVQAARAPRRVIRTFDRAGVGQVARRTQALGQIPRVSQLPGVVAGYWTRSDGTDGLSMVVFESEDAARAAAELVPQMISEAVTLENVEVRQVVANV